MVDLYFVECACLGLVILLDFSLFGRRVIFAANRTTVNLAVWIAAPRFEILF